MSKRIISIFMILTIAFSCIAISAYAEESNPNEGIAPAYNYTISCSSTLSISSGKATCRSTVVGMSGITTKIVFTQRLQKKVDGSWTNVKSWTGTYNIVSAAFTNTKSSLASGTYRTRTIAKVYSGSAYEKVTSNSTTVTI